MADTYSNPVPVRVVTDGGVPVQQVDDEAVGTPVITVDDNGAVSEDTSRIYSSPLLVRLTEDTGLPVKRVNKSGLFIDTNLNEPEFNIPSLFTGGIAGAWYDPSDLSTMSQNHDGTVAAAVDQPVGRILDKSGNGFHATQTVASNKPILRLDGGRYYLEFDGVDDRLTTVMTVAQPFDRISAIQQLSWTSGDIVFGSTVADYGTLYQSAVSPRLRLYSGAAGPNSVPITEPAVGTNVVISERFNGASSLLTLNNGTAATGDPGAAAPSALHISGRPSGAYGHFRLYGLLMIGRALTDDETTRTRRLIGEKAGIIL